MPAPDIIVRPATPADIPAAARIYVVAHDEVMQRRFNRPAQADTADAVEDDLLARDDLRILLVDDPAQVQIACPADDPARVLGFAAFWVRDHWWFLDYLYVHPDAQNRGIGRAMLDRCHAIGREAGCSLFSLCASTDPRALNRYIRLGLVPQPPTLNLGADPASLSPPPLPWDDGLDALPLGAGEPDDAARLQTLGDLDRAVRGTRRAEDLDRWLREGASGALLTRRDSGAPAGYFLLQPANLAGTARIGPVVALDGERVATVVTRALAALARFDPGPATAWRISVPGQNTAALPPLLAAGFRPRSLSNYLASAPIGQWDRYVFRDEDFL